jgi:hypothetical protein
MLDHTGGEHKLSVADIKNIVFAMKSHIWTLQETLELWGVNDERANEAISSLNRGLILLGQPENTAELHKQWIDCPEDS